MTTKTGTRDMKLVSYVPLNDAGSFSKLHASRERLKENPKARKFELEPLDRALHFPVTHHQ